MSDKTAQGVAEVMRLVDDHASSQIYSYSKRTLVEQAITAIITERDALRDALRDAAQFKVIRRSRMDHIPPMVDGTRE